ncbi:MAG: YkgJ family cysteine cluster protein [Thermoplasmatota archaeon]
MSDVCGEKGCALCCYETEMPLAESDIVRLVAKGHARESFVERDEFGIARLRNVAATLPREGFHCTFLVNDRCSVYADRPEGCRSYPVILTGEGRVVRDDECPHRQLFPISIGAGRRLARLANTIDKESRAFQRGR